MEKGDFYSTTGVELGENLIYKENIEKDVKPEQGVQYIIQFWVQKTMAVRTILEFY